MDINLLNWRHKRNVIANNRFFAVLGAVVLGCALLTASGNLIVMLYMMQSESNVALLDNELKGLEGNILKIKEIEDQKTKLLKKRATIEKLQKGRTFLVRAWEDIARVMPDGIVLSEMSNKSNEISLVGTSTNNEQVAALMKSVQGLQWVESAKLGEIKAVVVAADAKKSGQSAGIDFRLQIYVKPDFMGIQRETTGN